MDTIFTLSDNDEGIKINIDELYEKKKQNDLNTLTLYNRILNRVHQRIRTTSRQRKQEQFCWFIVPEMIIGIPKYNNGECIAYIIDKLKENGFAVKYTHPNLLLISWANYCPTYVRQEIKKKLGKVVDQFGEEVISEEEKTENANRMSLPFSPQGYAYDPLHQMQQKQGHTQATSHTQTQSSKEKEYKPINTYQPSGLIYNETLLRSIEDKTR